MVAQLAPAVPGGTHLAGGIQPSLVGVVRRLGAPGLAKGDKASDLDGVGQFDDGRDNLAAIEYEPARFVAVLRAGGPQALESAEEADVAVQGQVQIAAPQAQDLSPRHQGGAELLLQIVRGGPQGFDRVELFLVRLRRAVRLVGFAQRIGPQLRVLLAPAADRRGPHALLAHVVVPRAHRVDHHLHAQVRVGHLVLLRLVSGDQRRRPDRPGRRVSVQRELAGLRECDLVHRGHELETAPAASAPDSPVGSIVPAHHARRKILGPQRVAVGHVVGRRVAAL
ncbi:MAG: hypothetical protein MUF48_22920 [Pirellulaceae bacterium]|nr:hypothetical protein [Pirellulaceae bacterium]